MFGIGWGLLSVLRLNWAAASLSYLAILANIFLSLGWMPASASTGEQGLSIIICTAAGPAHLIIGADGKPVPQRDQPHDHQCCPCGGARHFAPLPILFASLSPANDEGTTVFRALLQGQFVSLALTPHSARAPPSLA